MIEIREHRFKSKSEKEMDEFNRQQRNESILAGMFYFVTFILFIFLIYVVLRCPHDAYVRPIDDDYDAIVPFVYPF